MDNTARAKYLRFALEELSAHNGQFEFEALCQEVIKARVASNLVTATGPVAAKGDQGRDAETYVSYLQDELGPHSAFLALLTKSMAAVCCTLQRDNLKGKFKDDAEKVVSSGAEVERIYAMCSIPIAAGLRHEIEQESSHAAGGVPVQLFDGVWIAQQLANSELFWVAERYLALDEAMGPPAEAGGTETLDERYLAAREHWRGTEGPRPLRADFYELRAGLRTAKEPGPARPDLPLWLEKVERLLDLELDEDLAMQVRYELAVCTLIGKRDLRPADHHVVDFFTNVVESDHPFRLMDAQTLLWFLYSMVRSGRTSITPEQIAAWGETLRERLQSLLAEDPTPTRRAFFRFALGNLLLAPKPEQIEVPEVELELPEIDVIRESFDDADLAFGAEALIDAAAAVTAWRELLDELPDGSLFPLERLADQMSMMASILIDVPGWKELTAALDGKLASASGRSVVGERALARGVTLGEADRPLDAIAELHTAKSNLFGGDSVRESVQALSLLSTAYLELRLPTASKQYALASAYASLVSERDEVTDLGHVALARAAYADLIAGNWLSAIRSAAATLAAANEQIPPGEIAEGTDEDIRLAIGVMQCVVAAARDLGECYELAIMALFGEKAASIREEILEQTQALTPEEWAVRTGEMGLLGPPFADARPNLALRFAALGIEWTIGPVGPEARGAAERLAAAAEVLSAELARRDLCLLRGEVSVEVATVERAADELDDPIDMIDADGPPGKWKVTLGTGKAWLDDPNLVTRELFLVLMAIIGERSLLPHDELGELVKAALTDGTTGKLFAARAFDQLVDELLGDIPDLTADCDPCFEPLGPTSHANLGWCDGPGPTYDPEIAKADLESRYAKLVPPIQLTLPRLLADPAAREAIEALKRDELLDWHVLQAINGIVQGFRLPEGAREWDHNRIEEFMLRPEVETMPEIPLELFSEENLRASAKTGLLATLQTVGLENRSRGPDTEAIRELLAARYGYLSNDIEHPDFLAET
jgi:hypothetical protein